MTRRRQHFSPYSAAGYRAFRWQIRRRPSLRLSASAVLLAASLLWVAASVAGERAYLRAARAAEASVTVLELIRAEVLAPWNGRIREAQAEYLARLDSLPPMVALVALRRALEQAPGNARLHVGLIDALLRAGDPTQAAQELPRLQALAPDWPETRAAAAAIKEATR